MSGPTSLLRKHATYAAREQAPTAPRPEQWALHGRGLWLVGLFALGLAARLAILAVNRGALEQWEYDTLAQNIVAGQGYVIQRFGHLAFAFGDGNLYSFLSAAIYAVVGHNEYVLAVAQALIASLAGPVIFALGRHAFDTRVAAVGAGLAAVHPALLAYTLKLHPLGLDVLLVALTLLWIERAGDGTSGRVMAGLAMGMSLMTRPTFLVASVVATAARWLPARRTVMPVLVPLCVALLIAMPWLVRNWVVLGRPVFISTSLEDVWKGNNPIASGSSYLPTGQDVFSAAPPRIRARFERANELELNDVFAGEIVGFVSQQPGAFAALTARKFVYFWWLSPQAGLSYPSGWRAGYESYLVVVSAFGLVGALAILRAGDAGERRLLAMLFAFALTLAIIHALAYVEGRHRWAIEPLLLLVTARGFFVIVDALRARIAYPS